MNSVNLRCKVITNRGFNHMNAGKWNVNSNVYLRQDMRLGKYVHDSPGMNIRIMNPSKISTGK